VNVKVGSFSDDDDMPGMAHAVEHLLFMGTEKVVPFVRTCVPPRLTGRPVSQGKRLQPIPDRPRRLLQRLHRRHRDQLLLRSRRLRRTPPRRRHQRRHHLPAAWRPRSLRPVLHRPALSVLHPRPRAESGGLGEQEKPAE
jgi:hypothetical protein